MKLRTLLYSFLKYHNRWDLLKSAVRGREPDFLILPNRIRIYSPPNNDTLTMVKDIFFDNLYTIPYLTLEKNDLVVDIGANIGVFTLFAAGITHNQVYSFEPFPSNYAFLSRNIHENSLITVKTFPTALCDYVGTVKLYVAAKSGGNQLFKNADTGEYPNAIVVPADTLQNFMDQNVIEKIDFLKLDCEGAEGAILNSTPIPYLKRIRKISMEFHDNVSLLKHEEIQELLHRAGFKTTIRWNGKSHFGYIYAERD